MKKFAWSIVCSLSLCTVTAMGADPQKVRVLVWDEQQPEQKRAYDGSFLGLAIAAHLSKQPGFEVKSKSIESPDQGISVSDLDSTDVIVWWGHVRNRELNPERVTTLVERVRSGQLAYIGLHSAHWSRPFIRLMEARALADAQAKLSLLDFKQMKVNRPEPWVAPKRNDPLTPSLQKSESGIWALTLPGCCFPAYRPDGAPSHVTTLLPDHPIAQGLPSGWTIPQTEMYDEPFHVPPPDEVVFRENWDKGEHFRSGCVWRIGQGNVFYFRPGHETYPVFKQAENLRVVENAARWLGKSVTASTNSASPNNNTKRQPSTRIALPGENLTVAGRDTFIFLPPESKRSNPQPWIFYAPTLPPYPDESERWMHEQFVEAGVAVAGIDVGEGYGSPASQVLFNALYQELTEKRNFALKPCLFGRSRGGLWVTSWAVSNPTRVAGIIGIYPVFDFRTYPGIDKAAQAYGVTPAQFQEHAKDYNPIAGVERLAKARIPVALIHGDDDKVVPLKENSAEFQRRYKEVGAGDLIHLIVLKGQGHTHNPAFFHSQELVDFAVRQAKAASRPDFK
jgi:trehalose utilization protein